MILSLTWGALYQKCALAQLFRAKAFLLFGIIFCFQIAAVRTFSMVFAASF